MKNIELEIVDYGYDGEGVAKQDGKVFFVPKSIIGEKVKVDIVKQNAKFCHCKVTEVLKKSTERQSPPCPYFDKCGGCNFQHISYEKELEIKKNRLLKEFGKICDLSDIEIAVGAREYGYRNKVRFKVCDRKLGFFEEKSNNFLEVKKCLLLCEEMNIMIEKINTFLSQSKHKFDEVVLHNVGGNILVDFHTKENVKEEEVNKHFPFAFVNHKGQAIESEEFGLKYCFLGDMFRQVNEDVASKIYSEASEIAKGKVIVNAFSGAGVLSGILAKKASKVYGIELNKSASKSAEELKEKNNIFNLINICGYVEKELDKIEEKVDCIVLDPPRAGCDKAVLEYILTKEIPLVIYVSCNPATIVRDLSILKSKFEIKTVKAFDMFPRTANIETMAVLSLKSLTK